MVDFPKHNRKVDNKIKTKSKELKALANQSEETIELENLRHSQAIKGLKKLYSSTEELTNEGRRVS